MRKLLLLIVMVTTFICLSTVSIWADDSANTTYKMKLSEYYQLNIEEIDAIIDTTISLEEVPIVLVMAQYSKKTPTEVLEIYKPTGKWSVYMMQHRIHQSSVLVDVLKFKTAECVAITKKIKNIPLNNVEFSNEDIVIMINYAFLANSYKVKLDEIVKYRDVEQDNFKTFIEISSLLSGQLKTDKVTSDIE